MDEIEGFDRDAGNWPKCGKHGVSRAEIEAVFLSGPRVFEHPSHSQIEQRLLAIGRNNAGRAVYVAFTIRPSPEGELIRPVSARYMHQEEIDHYERRYEQR